MNSLTDPTVAEVLERLHKAADAQRPTLRERLAPLDDAPADAWPEIMRDLYLPVTREQGRFLYQTVRAVGARRVVEFGTSFGISTIYLAAGLRDNGGGVVVGSELFEEKAATARDHLTAAGLGAYAEIRPGDARTTLLDPGGPVDVVLLDGGPGLYVEILRALVPHLRVGAVIVADNVDGGGPEPDPYTSWVRDPANGFVSCSIGLRNGTEHSVWLGPPGPRPAS
ncbi:MAG: class I SAM-dependent methyltransferase [Actinomycetota bacterium]